MGIGCWDRDITILERPCKVKKQNPENESEASTESTSLRILAPAAALSSCRHLTLHLWPGLHPLCPPLSQSHNIPSHTASLLLAETHIVNAPVSAACISLKTQSVVLTTEGDPEQITAAPVCATICPAHWSVAAANAELQLWRLPKSHPLHGFNMDHTNWSRTSNKTAERAEVLMTEIIFQQCFNKSHVSATCSHIQEVWQRFKGCATFSQEGRIKVFFFTGYIHPSDAGWTIIIFHSRNTHLCLDFDWQKKRGKEVSSLNEHRSHR